MKVIKIILQLFKIMMLYLPPHKTIFYLTLIFPFVLSSGTFESLEKRKLTFSLEAIVTLATKEETSRGVAMRVF